MSYEFLSVERCEGYIVLTLNRPKANALSLDLVREIRAAVAEADADVGVRCIVITGGKGRFFSAGADVPSLGKSLAEPFAEGGLLAEGLKMVDTVEACTTPVVAAVNGVAVGGGCELILACCFRIAADSAQFGQPEINLGIIPGWGGCHRLPRMIGEARAMDWIVTGRMVRADEAYEAGLVCKVVPAAELQDAAKDFAAHVAGQPPIAVRAAMRVVRERSLYPERGKALEAEGLAEVADSKDAVEGIAAFLEKRSARFTGE